MKVQASDGVELYVRDWPLAPGGARRGSALIIHGLGEHSGRYAHVAAALNAIGIAARSYDHRGFGQSGGAKAVLPYPDALLDDAKQIYETFAQEALDAGEAAPPFLIGHSMGGAIAARAVTGGWIAPRGLVLSSPGLKSYLSAAARWAIHAAAKVTPHAARPHGLPLGKISHDAEVLTEAEADPHNHRIATPRLISFVLDAGERARSEARNVKVPTLVMAAGDDHLVDPAGAREFFDALPPSIGTLHWYDGLYHEIFNEREPDRTRVLGDLTAWLAKQCGGG